MSSNPLEPEEKRDFSTGLRQPRPNEKNKGVVVDRHFTDGKVHPFEAVEWEIRTASITNEQGEVIFEQRNVEIPKSWSQSAANIVVSKYFHGRLDSPKRETSVKQLIGRVVDTITNWGLASGYFKAEGDASVFSDELTFLLVNQYLSFNSPVWFNCGIEEHPQCSACFINSVQDNMESILGLARTEGRLFKWGSGTGTNLSPLRSSRESLSSGGTASGPVSFMKGYDSFAGAIKSGGKTRRAAKMVILNADHPDIEDFVVCKANEEKKAWALIDAGYDGSYTGEAYGSIFFQNANNSVRASDEFMQAVRDDEEWITRGVVSGSEMGRFRARDLMRKISEAAWICGDPGMQFDSTINKWHTCKETARINASNPCSEYMFLDDSACNLASLNLMKFADEKATFAVEAFRRAVDVAITAQEIIVGNASYPTEKIGRNSHDFRPLGLGYANLGALLMYQGLPYDSDEGRAYAAAITAVMTGQGYLTSSRLASEMGAFDGYAANTDAFLDVIGMHLQAACTIDSTLVPAGLMKAATQVWDEALAGGKEHGYRNAQVSVLAPTGTIGFMMDCDTTGVEPDLALIKYKKLVGGGSMKIVNNTVPHALAKLGYAKETVARIVAYIDENGTIEGAPGLKESHLPVFDCAFKPINGVRSIHYLGHLKMMGAVQPFLSGAISKTVNLPEAATIEEIEQAYMESWKLGIKAIAVYRDNCKRSQPMSTSSDSMRLAAAELAAGQPVRRKLPDERAAITHKFDIAGHEGYITVGMFNDGTPGEIFLTMSKEGSTISGLMDAFATAISMTLQYGVPLKALIDKFSHMRFEPSGFTKNPEIPIAKSTMDYIFRWLASKFLSAEERDDAGVVRRDVSAAVKVMPPRRSAAVAAVTTSTRTHQEDAPACSDCGAIMVRNGSCYKCLNCGTTSGCS